MINEKSHSGNVAIIGAGVMGSGIAALMANLGWRVTLLDRVPDDAGTDPKSRNRLAQTGLDRALKSRPALFALPEYAKQVRIGNVEDNLEWLRDADWIVEAVAEDLSVKRALFAKIAPFARPSAVISSNTSGLSLAGMVSECPPDFRARFLGTHFFNPPRYMKPLELIPQAKTDPAVFEAFARFADRVLGKRVIRAKDTPGFISTRLGMYSLIKAIQLAVEMGMTIEEADYLTGPLLGRPKSGTFRLADIIGLDITAHIRDNLAASLPDDCAYQSLRIPDLMRRLIADGRTGAKADAGFYRREKSGEILSLDIETGDYRPRREPQPIPAEITALSLNERIGRLWNDAPARYREFLHATLADTLGYMAEVTPLLSDRIVEVDDSLTGGFGWEVGPFHLLDALGEIEWPGKIPSIVQKRTDSKLERFYDNVAGAHFFFDYEKGRMERLHRPAGVLVLKDLKRAGSTVEDTSVGSLVDLGDGVLCAEWRTKMNTLDPEVTRFLDRARERTESDFLALVLGGASEHFSAGFNLGLLAEKIEARGWDWIDQTMCDLQQTLLRVKYARVPIVAAVCGYALGGGCEVMLHARAVQATFECSIGLSEANVGLIPVGGGLAQMLLRAMYSLPGGTILEPSDPYPALKPVWDNLRSARFSLSAPEARALGYLREEDGITHHPDRLLHDAKDRALALSSSYVPAVPATAIATGQTGSARFRWEIYMLRGGRQISDHDARIAEKLAWVLTGGTLLYRGEVTEQYLLDLEREAFLSLAGTPESLARIRHLLATGKPLRN